MLADWVVDLIMEICLVIHVCMSTVIQSVFMSGGGGGGGEGFGAKR